MPLIWPQGAMHEHANDLRMHVSRRPHKFTPTRQNFICAWRPLQCSTSRDEEGLKQCWGEGQLYWPMPTCMHEPCSRPNRRFMHTADFAKAQVPCMWPQCEVEACTAIRVSASCPAGR